MVACRPIRLLAVLTLATLSGMLTSTGCAGPAASGRVSPGGAETATGAATSAVVGTTAPLAGGRCEGGVCACRNRNANPAESPPPDEGHKRFELRLAAEDGVATLTSATLGTFGAGSNEACYYLDLVPGTTHDVTFVAREGAPEGGVGPRLSVAEYGPKGPFWYQILDVRCAGPGGKCTRDAADEWGQQLRKRKRGRLDPCGSTVITNLNWSTSGGTAQRDSGLYRDFTVKFTMEVKTFATQFAPGSTECVPK